MTDTSVGDAWFGYDDIMEVIFAVDNSVIPRVIIPTVPACFFLADTGSGVSRFARNTLTITGVSVFIPLIRVDYEGDEVICPKWLVS